MTDYRKSSKTRLVEALNKANPKYPILVDNLLFGNAVSWVHNGRNSKVIVTPNNGNLTGKRTIHYNRLDLAIAFAALEVPAIVIPSTVTRTHELLPLILQQYGVLLLPEEIIDEDLTTPDIILRTVPGAIGWVGSVTIDSGGVVVPPIINGFMLDDGSFFALDDGNLFYLDDMNVTLQP